MPYWVQQTVWLNPLVHFLLTSKGIFLKDMTIFQVWQNTWPLLIIGTVSLILASRLFARRMG
jgi:ABC-2 type transport system permease protein